MTPNRWIAVGAVLGAIGVALGAYGAHGLDKQLAAWGYTGDELTKRLANHETAVRYQMWHALAIVLVGVALASRANPLWQASAWALLLGVLVFSGFLYALVLTGANFRWFGAIVPIGGVLMIVGWALLAIGAWRTH